MYSLEDTSEGQGPDSQIAKPGPGWWTRLVGNIKRKMDERKAKKKDEPSVDRAARITARATVWMAIFTLVLAVTSGLTVLILKNQLKEMHEGGIDTHALADAASDQADAAQQFSDTVEDINGGIAAAANQLEVAANNAKASINATKEAMRLDQRAWVGVLASMPKIEAKKSITGTAVVMNSGKTFAVKTTIDSSLTFSPIKVREFKQLPPPEQVPEEERSVGLLIPNTRFETRATPHTPDGKPKEATDLDITRFAEQGWYTYIYGTVTYYDIFKRHHRTDFCWYRTGIEGDFSQCQMHNSAT